MPAPSSRRIAALVDEPFRVYTISEGLFYGATHWISLRTSGRSWTPTCSWVRDSTVNIFGFDSVSVTSLFITTPRPENRDASGHISRHV